MEIIIMILGLLVVLTLLFIFKKYPEIRRRIKEKKLEADYFRRMSKR